MDPKEYIPKNVQNKLLSMTVIFFFLLLGTIFSVEVREISFSYLILTAGSILLILLVRLDVQEKILLLTLSFVLLSIFGVQFLLYYLLPDYYNYQPVTNPQLQMIFQTGGKYQIFYSPDYPKQGDKISGYVSICKNDYSECHELDSYTLQVYFYDESNQRHDILNKTLQKGDHFEIEYLYDPLQVDIKYMNETLSFVLPKRSLWQVGQYEFNRHPGYSFISFLTGIIGVFTVIKISTIKDFLHRCWGEYMKDIQSIRENKLLPKDDSKTRLEKV